MGQSIIHTTGGWVRRNLNVAGANLTFNMGGSQQVDFIPSGNITAPKTWVVNNSSNAYQFMFRFTLTGLYVQTMPANFEMADPLFDSGVWTPIDLGTYEAMATFDGTNWFLKIVGLY